jgi:hypothetical protein
MHPMNISVTKPAHFPTSGDEKSNKFYISVKNSFQKEVIKQKQAKVISKFK